MYRRLIRSYHCETRMLYQNAWLAQLFALVVRLRSVLTVALGEKHQPQRGNRLHILAAFLRLYLPRTTLLLLSTMQTLAPYPLLMHHLLAPCQPTARSHLPPAALSLLGTVVRLPCHCRPWATRTGATGKRPTPPPCLA
eukprot:TRINITY_DN57758_c0_g1_i1.p3 TRINITY_DN57758_c0_g1~~TRINITY_DN57758_c0_g1_i1.p3  ORF type:complete len:139 (+),score=6.18 TRINITY_DN57758_c0_g1_i1:131-547(+)